MRWIAATHGPLTAMVKQGTFREDLYHRLAVSPVNVPALGDRPEDFVPLAERLLVELSEARRTVPTLSAAAKARITSPAWQGSVRQLHNALQRAMTPHDGPVLDAELFAADAAEHLQQELTDDNSLESLERRAIEAVVIYQRAAAARPGIGLRTLYKKLKRQNSAGT